MGESGLFIIIPYLWDKNTMDMVFLMLLKINNFVQQK